ncbi:dienelactone hydrolase family protein [uncultured Pseudokineococcus sp.]|uniref:dienelactone hydrolase family protein n=1 Tax=uncultured Pseudokineococcus sp. TaxID=1642928 RepID=UPI00262DF792|nr:dienelactone hydrolase family protein [uncultured Pseudokineococcus sp.]
MTTTSVPGPGGSTMPAYLSTPVATQRDPGPWPGVVVVHDAFGMSDDMRDQADWLAAAGHVALLPDLYSRDGRTQGWGRVPCVARTMQQLGRGEGPAFERLESARAALAQRDDCTGTVGVIGFCMGGGFALLLAGRPGWSAASVNYGILPDDDAALDAAVQGACPVVASFGGADRLLAGAAARVEGALSRAGVPHDVREYDGVQHGFITRTADTSPLVPVMRRVMGVSHDHEASADARRRILGFFDEHLRGRGVDDADQVVDQVAGSASAPLTGADDEPVPSSSSAPVGWVGAGGAVTTRVG